jgi:hypothetical protein
MIELDDWAAHMMRAEIQLKAIEKKLLRKDYQNIQAHAAAAKRNIDKMLAWVARQGSSKGVDVVEILQGNVAALPDSSHTKSLLIASIQEIEQLRNERQFWLRSGFDIGKQDAVKE